MAIDIDGTDDIIDTSQAEDRIDELESEIEDAIELEEDHEEEDKELAKLKELREDIGGDWIHGINLINDDHFEDYARQFAEDMGSIDSEAAWPATCIDWEQAATELQHDYTVVEFDGGTFYYIA